MISLIRYSKTIGILGGMGPAATVNLFDRMVRSVKVAIDQDHPRIIIVNNPKIPDRTAAILENGTDPLPMMLEGARFLAMAHADFIVIPCITAHFYHARLQEQVSIPILHAVRETMRYMAEKHRGTRSVGLLATTGTVQSGLFGQECADAGMELIIPAKDIQAEKVMKAIYNIKAAGTSSEAKALIREAAETLIHKGAQAIIAGCTEIPLVLADGDLSVPVIDPLALLAERALQAAQ